MALRPKPALSWDFSRCWSCQAESPRQCASRTRRNGLGRLDKPQSIRFASTTRYARIRTCDMRSLVQTRTQHTEATPTTQPPVFDAVPPPHSRQFELATKHRFKSNSKIRKDLWQAFIDDTQAAEQEEIRANFQSLLNRADPTSTKADDDPQEYEYDDDLMHEFDRLSAPYEGSTETEAVMHSGDLIEINDNENEGRLAVFLGVRNMISIFYSIEGALVTAQKRSCSFLAPGWFSKEEIAPLLDNLPEEISSTNASTRQSVGSAMPVVYGGAVIAKLNTFKNNADECYRSNAERLDTLYDRVRHEDVSRFYSIDYLVDIAFEQKEQTKWNREHMRYATSVAALRAKYGFSVDPRSLVQLKGFNVEPKLSTDAVRAARAWLRAYQELQTPRSLAKKSPSFQEAARVVAGFVKTARKLVQVSRQIRDTSADGLYLSVKNNLDISKLEGIDGAGRLEGNVLHAHKFTKSESQIITFLSRYAVAKTFQRYQSISGLVPVLIRAVNVYPEERVVDSQLVQRFLCEIGVMQPYETSVAWDRLLFTATQESFDGKLLERSDEEKVPSQVVDAKDSFENIRKDWGDLRAYVIDDASSNDADDAISVETVDEDAGIYWVHTHISHVSAGIHPQSDLGRDVEDRQTSLYFPDITLHMLPRWAIDSFQIAPNRHALTHSIMVDTRNKKILEYQLQPSIIRNVVRLSYEDVDEGIFNHTAAEPILEWKMFKKEKKTTDRFLATVDKQTITDFKHLLHVGIAIGQGTEARFYEQAGIDTKAKAWLPVERKISAYRADLYERSATYELENPEVHLKSVAKTSGLGRGTAPTENIVPVIMTEVCVQCAKWAAARNIAMPFMGTQEPVHVSEEERSTLRESFELVAAKGSDPVLAGSLFTIARQLFGVRHVSSHPIQQRFLGVGAYTKVTSPLRRYFDLIACWQIDAYLRKEAGIESRGFSALTHEAMDKIIERHERNILYLRRFSAAHEKNWILYAIAQALYTGKVPLQNRFMASVLASSNMVDSVRLEAINIPATLLSPAYKQNESHPTGFVGEDGNAVAAGQRWEMEVYAVDLHNRLVHVKPIRLDKDVSSDVADLIARL